MRDEECHVRYLMIELLKRRVESSLSSVKRSQEVPGGHPGVLDPFRKVCWQSILKRTVLENNGHYVTW